MIQKTLEVELPNCPLCGDKATAVEKGGYGYFNFFVGCSDKDCEFHEIDRTGGKVKSRGTSHRDVIASWKKRVADFQGRTPLVRIKPNDMELTLDMHCPRCREKIVITRVGTDCYKRDFDCSCPHCDEYIHVRLPKESK